MINTQKMYFKYNKSDLRKKKVYGIRSIILKRYKNFNIIFI